MDLSILVAKVLGIYFIISGFFLLLQGKTLAIILKDFFNHPAVVYLTGTILTGLGLVLIFEHNIWDGSWRTWISFLSVLILIKGLIYIFASKWLSQLHLERSRAVLFVGGILSMSAGTYLFVVSG